MTTHPCSTTTPNRGGRPTAYSPELVNRILATVREEGLSPTAATEKHGTSRATLSRWRRSYPNFAMRLQYARSEYRRVRLGKTRPRFTADGRPNWRTAARELELAFPEEYSMDPTRRAAFRAQRDAEAEEWERAKAEFARETSGTWPKSKVSKPTLPSKCCRHRRRKSALKSFKTPQGTGRSPRSTPSRCTPIHSKSFKTPPVLIP